MTQDEIDQRDAETRINIIRLSIRKYERVLNICPPEHYEETKYKLDQEKQRLEDFKDKYPEYFI